MSHLNIAFYPYASLGTVMHYILVISELCTSTCANHFIISRGSFLPKQ